MKLHAVAYVVAYGVSNFSTCADRLLKPFNPLLGETWEFLTDNYRVVTEQVSHHPPISASKK